MTRCLKALLVSIVFYPFTTPAGTIEVAQWIPWEFVTTQIYKEPLSIAIQESELQMNFSELSPRLQGLKIEIKGEINTLIFNSTGISSSQSFSADIHVERIIIDQLIIREFNGNQIQIHLKAECEPMSISIPVLNTSSNSEFIQEASRWQPELTEVGILIPDNSWRVSPISCSGIGGVGEEIASILTKALKNPTSFSPMIKTVISDQLKKTFKESWESLLIATGTDLMVTSMGKPTDAGFLVFAELNIKNNKKIHLPKPKDSLLSVKTPQLIFSVQGFEALLEDKFLNVAPQKFNLQNVPAFAGLMKSRTKKIFAWPDLRRFSSNTPFVLSTYTNQSQLRLSAKENGKWQANLNANGVLQTIIGGSSIDYINFGIGVATEVSIKVVDGKLHMSSGASQLEFAWNYAFLYQMIYRPNPRIAIDIFKSSLNQFFTNQAVEEKLPVLNFQNHEWKLQNWKQQNEIITMDWL